MIEWLIVLAIVYGAYIVLALVIQDRLIFPRFVVSKEAQTIRDTPGMEEVWLTGADGERIVAWYAIGQGRSKDSPGGAVMFAHGNGERIEDNILLAQDYVSAGVSVLMVEYRGYGLAPGSPGQRAIVGDLATFREWLNQRPEVMPGRVLYHGRSIGSGMITALAAKHKPAGIIVESGFTSMSAMFGRYGLPGLVCLHPLHTDDVLPSLHVPTLIMHGTVDKIVPVAHGRKLAAMTKGAVYVEFDCGHNDLPPDHRRYWQEIVQLLERTQIPIN